MKIFSFFFAKLALCIKRYPLFFIFAWLIIWAFAIPGALSVSNVLITGSGGSLKFESLEVKQMMEENFNFPFVDNHILLIESKKYQIDHEVFIEIVHSFKFLFAEEDYVTEIITYYDTNNSLMRSADGYKTFIVIGQKTSDAKKLEMRVPKIKEKIAAKLQELRKDDASLKIYLTGKSAIAYDFHIYTNQSTRRVEKQIIVITLIALLFAFRSIAGAILPIIMAIFSNIIGLAIIGIIAGVFPVAVYAKSISTMIGLGVGIDYSLLMVWRFREELEKTGNSEEAISEIITKTGASIFFSGFAVIVGLSGLLFTGIVSEYSIGLGGAVVVCVSVMLSLTFLPAILLLLGKRINFPQTLAKNLIKLNPSIFWERLAAIIMRTPIRFFIITLVFILVLATPALNLKIGQLDLQSLPSSLESKKALEILNKMSTSGVTSPINVIIKTTDDKTILHSEKMQAIYELCSKLQKHQKIAKVNGLYKFMEGKKKRELELLLSDIDSLQLIYPDLFEYFLSKDHSATFVQVIPKNADDLEYIAELCKELRNYKKDVKTDGLTIFVGGYVAVFMDYGLEVIKSLPWIIAGIITITYIVLFVAFRSFLLPLKAIVLNIFSVLVSYGTLVLVFQYGIIPGVPTSSVMIYVPLLLFCLVFGLSIDYEVFLITRIKEEYYNGSTNEAATIKGISVTGGVITYAALIMCIVFGTFATVELSIIRQLGFGLAVAIFVDATVVRMIMVPALMKIAGKWNWYPGKALGETK